MTECRCHSHNGFLTKVGLEEAAQRRAQGALVSWDGYEYVDKEGSVSVLERERDLSTLDLWDESSGLSGREILQYLEYQDG